MKVRPGVDLASLTDVGCVRNNNEDSYLYWEPESDVLFERLGRLATIADGMGGYEGGQIASRIAVEVVRDTYSSLVDLDPQDRLLRAFAEAHRRIQQHGSQKLVLNGMGTTCTAIALVKGKLYFAHVGDTRLYLLREGKLERLTHDHTLVAHWLSTGVISPDEAADHPRKHVLTAALGVAEQLQPDFPSTPLVARRGDVFMICSDGLWGQMEEAEIQSNLALRSLSDACKNMVLLANDRGGPDNITLLLLRII